MHRRLKESLLALCDHNPHEWYWRLPSALLSIRTTLKPDIGSSPADLVYGEGLSVPGDLHGEFPTEQPELLRQRRNAQANLRVEVARMQPTPTSAHRRPNIYIPPELADATHVFVKRGGVQSSFATPYEGPFRVVERLDSGYRVILPGGRLELVAMARLKPAHIDADDVLEDPEQHLDDARPPSPRPPGRPPGPRTRVPQPTDRVTRQSRREAPSSGPGPVAQPPPSRPSDARENATERTSAGPSRDPPSRPQRAAPARRRRIRLRTPNLTDFNSHQPEPIVPPNLADIPSGADPSVPDSPAELNSPGTIRRLQEMRSDACIAEQQLHDDDDPAMQPSFFELGKVVLPPAPTSAPAPAPPPAPSQAPSSSSGLTRPVWTRREENLARQGSSPSSLGPGRFSAKRDGQQDRHYFSDYRPRPANTRPRPDVSVILQHLGMSSTSQASHPHPPSSDLSAGGRVAIADVSYPRTHYLPTLSSS